MPRFDSKCLVCGEITENMVCAGGAHPPCPSCKGETVYFWTQHPVSIQTNEAFIGGQVIENLGHDPVTVYSRDELKVRMAEAGVEQRIKYVPGDHYLTDWSMGIDAQRLADVTALLSRPRVTRADREQELAALQSFAPSVKTLPINGDH